MSKEEIRVNVTNGGQATIHPQILIDNIPLGVFVSDLAGRVHHMNRRAAAMTGYTEQNVVGRSVLEFVESEDLDFLASSLIHGADYAGQVMGPIRLRYRAADGSTQWTECWAYECPPEFGIDGYIVTMSTESVTDNLSNAVRDIASGEPLDRSLLSVARAVNGYPLVADGTVMTRRGERLDLVGNWPFAERQFVDEVSMPWHTVMTSATPLDLDVAALPEPARSRASDAGYRSIWIRPVVTQSQNLAAVFVAWRYEPGFASPNQERHLDETVGVARLAFDHDEHRAQLQRAALTDHLTGLGNRVLLARHLEDIDDGSFTALYIDLDRFKLVNDNHGHDVGDSLLAAAAQRVLSAVRSSDAVFRMGGDEFVILSRLPSGGSDAEQPSGELAQRVVDLLSEPFIIGGQTLRIGASVGLALRQHDEVPDHVIRRADRALLEAKRAGKSRWCSADRPDPALQRV